MAIRDKKETESSGILEEESHKVKPTQHAEKEKFGIHIC